VLDKRPDNRLPSVARAAASPSAIVAAGAGVAVGEAAHLGLPVAAALGVAAYGARLGWAYMRRRSLRRSRALRREARVDPWAVPEPWRSLTARALRARAQLQQFARDCPPGPLADQVSRAGAMAAAAVEEQWGMARTGASLAPGDRLQQVASALEDVQSALGAGAGAGAGARPDRTALQGREELLAAELRSLHGAQQAADELSGRLSALVEELEQLATMCGRLLASPGPAAEALDALTSAVGSLVSAMDEARRESRPGGPGGPG
jgi:hypothetical protein